MQITDPKLAISGKAYPNKPEYIIIHHALKRNCTIQDVHQWHLDRKMNGCGYHYFIAKDGNIYKGRDETRSGAHCKEKGMNAKSIGICVEGCYEDYASQTDKDMPFSQFNALRELIKYLQSKYSIPITNMLPHRYFATYKKCPGNYFPWDRLMSVLKYTDPNAVTIIVGAKQFSGKLIGNVTYAPVRAVAEALGKTVRWEEDERAVYIEGL